MWCVCVGGGGGRGGGDHLLLTGIWCAGALLLLQSNRQKLQSRCRAVLFDEEVRFSGNIDFQYPMKKVGGMMGGGMLARESGSGPCTQKACVRRCAPNHALACKPPPAPRAPARSTAVV